MKESLSHSENGAAEQSARNQFLVVGIGASAGGIQALQSFFQNVPVNSGVAYVVILHLSPDHDSRLAQVLQTATKIPITQVTEKVSVEPNHVYVVPPNKHLEMLDGSIIVSPNTLLAERRAPVDIFFRTLAESHGESAVAVVLSGTGANGSMGIKRIKERGGAAFVQNPREAEYNEMPRNSIATELVDDILPVAEIPARIIAYRDSLGKIEIPVDAEQRPEEQQLALRDIFTHLKVRTGHDFSNYKRPTLLRRIERRINVRNLPSLSSYAAYLKENFDEPHALLKDLLISVTNFFRDQKAFEALERDLLPRIFQGKKNGDQVRIWVPGCATGEEAYSLAMLCAERVQEMIDAPKVQIFATDIDEAALTVAREGLYTINDAADVSPERLHRYFLKDGEAYRIRREIREMVLFANHNVIKDPPFSHLDLVSCRNMLIYLNSVAQERVMETLHFALNPGGYLFLGTSESVYGASDLFASVSRDHHIFQRRQTSARPFPVPESVPTFRIEPLQSKSPLPESESRTLERISYGDLHQQLLEQFAPPSIIVNEEYDIVHLSERAGRYLQIAGGEPSKNLLSLIRPELRLELRAALYQAVQQRSNVEAGNLKVSFENHTEVINLLVRPVLREGHTARGFILVIFEQSPDPPKDNEKLSASDESMAHHLEEELIRLHGRLRTSSEEYELQAEELKASNEELQAINEELRSAAEELETSKEELQSINEELQTVNQELKVKIEEVTLTSDNLQNLINSSNIATVFLDRSFRVQLFSPTARELFNLIPTDFGRPLTDITNRLEYANLLDDVENVLKNLQTLEREVRSTDGRIYAMRVLPYRTAEDNINGVVLTFMDFTERKQIEMAVAEDLKDTSILHELSVRMVSEDNIEVLYGEVLTAAIALMRADAGTIQALDQITQELVLIAARGFDPEMSEHFHRVDKSSNTSCGIALATGKRTFIVYDAADMADPDGSLKMHFEAGYLSAQSTPLVTRLGKIIGMLSTHWPEHHQPTTRELRFLDLLARQAADLIEQWRVDEALRVSEALLQKAFSTETVGVLFFGLDGNVQNANEAFLKMSGFTREELLNTVYWEMMTPPDFMEVITRAATELIAKGETAPYEKQLIRKDGSQWWGLFAPTRLSGNGKASHCVEFVIDITETKAAEEALRTNMDEMMRLNRSMVGRELRMIELKKEVNELCTALGKPERYPLELD